MKQQLAIVTTTSRLQSAPTDLTEDGISKTWRRWQEIDDHPSSYVPGKRHPPVLPRSRGRSPRGPPARLPRDQLRLAFPDSSACPSLPGDSSGPAWIRRDRQAVERLRQEDNGQRY